jgi:ketosteroid isomerase-like protein
MKKFFVLIALIMLNLFSAVLQAQQWTAEQNEVWKTVENYNQLIAKRDTAILNYYDESYRGWDYSFDAPGSKENLRKIFYNFDLNYKILYQSLIPATIWVNENFAYVHYYYTTLIEAKDGRREREKGRWTDILIKKGDKWILIGDHGGRTPKQ